MTVGGQGTTTHNPESTTSNERVRFRPNRYFFHLTDILNMSKSRRKTLSHMEIEDFLSEISNNTAALDSKRQSILPSHSLISYDPAEDIVPSDIVPLEEDEYDLMRKFCKISMDLRNYSSEKGLELRSIARGIVEKTNYKLMSSRLLTDEVLPPLGSTEAKRALLLSLTPMLNEAEEVRKKDLEQCEFYTRCKSSKAKGRGAVYEYVDMDTNTKMAYVDFEARYMAFIYRHKVAPTTKGAIDIAFDSAVDVAGVEVFVCEPNTVEADVADSSASIETSSGIIESATIGVDVHLDIQVDVHMEIPVSIVHPTPNKVLKADDVSKDAAIENEDDKENQHVSASRVRGLASPTSISKKKLASQDRKRKHEASSSARRNTLSPSSMKAILLASLGGVDNDASSQEDMLSVLMAKRSGGVSPANSVCSGRGGKKVRKKKGTTSPAPTPARRISLCLSPLPLSEIPDATDGASMEIDGVTNCVDSTSEAPATAPLSPSSALSSELDFLLADEDAAEGTLVSPLPSPVPPTPQVVQIVPSPPAAACATPSNPKSSSLRVSPQGTPNHPAHSSPVILDQSLSSGYMQPSDAVGNISSPFATPSLSQTPISVPSPTPQVDAASPTPSHYFHIPQQSNVPSTPVSPLSSSSLTPCSPALPASSIPISSLLPGSASPSANASANVSASVISTPLPNMSTPAAKTPCTAFFGPRSPLHVLISEALKILGGAEEESRLFEQVEQLVAQHLASHPHTYSQTVSYNTCFSQPLLPLPPSPSNSLQPDLGDVADESLDGLPLPVDVRWAERMAENRRQERVREAHARYVWEVVSAQAASKGREVWIKLAKK